MQQYGKLQSSYPRITLRTGRPNCADIWRHRHIQAGLATFIHNKLQPKNPVEELHIPAHLAGHLMLIQFSPPSQQPRCIFNVCMPDRGTRMLSPSEDRLCRVFQNYITLTTYPRTRQAPHWYWWGATLKPSDTKGMVTRTLKRKTMRRNIVRGPETVGYNL